MALTLANTFAMTLPDTYKALVSNGDKTASVRTIPLITDLQPHEVLIRIRSIGLNPTDWKRLNQSPPEGVVLGCDSAGDVIKVGSDVKHIHVGDRVSALVYGASSNDNGAFAEYVRLDYHLTIKVPKTVSYNEAASLPVPHETAALGLYAHLHLATPSHPANKEDIILIWGGSTATGHHAIQLAVQSGLRVFVTASKAAHEHLRELGAERCFDYRDEDVVTQIKEAAGEIGVKYAFDTVAEGGTGVKVVDAIGPQGGKVITILTQKDIEQRRPDVEVIFILLYLTMAPAFGLPFRPQDQAGVHSYLTDELPALLEGWEEGKGSSKLKPQKLRVLEGGLEKITEGFAIMQKGAYGREKLVYPIL